MPEAVIGLIGNPNCGKSTLFNTLTGARQVVGNWPGVTVERKSGQLQGQQQKCTLIDLPGTYSLDSSDDETPADEHIARQFLLNGEADLIINIVDANNLQRHLYLTAQLLDMQVPLICVVNMVDVAARHGKRIDCDALAKQLGVPVIPMVAASGKGTEALRQHIDQQLGQPCPTRPVTFDDPQLEAAIMQLCQPSSGISASRFHAVQWLHQPEQAPAAVTHCAQQLQQSLQQQQSIDARIASQRYTRLADIVANVSHSEMHAASLTEKIDHWVLNRWLGIPIFFLVMYFMFTFAINIGGAFIDFFDIAAATIFVDGSRWLLDSLSSPAWLTTILADGIGGGIQLVATFVPVIAGLYLVLSFIEDSGYMARAAFVMDRLMRSVGLPGKSFVPLIVGFGCNVPAVMAARSLDTHKDRLLTIAMAPFMSCGARLSVYAMFAAVFFHQHGASVVFALYVLGIAMAILTGLALKKTLFRSDLTPFVMEMPAYHVPTLKGVLWKTWQKLKAFCTRAGKTIVMVVVLLSFINSIGTDGSFGNQNRDDSALSALARVVTPVFAPMGVAKDNWQATVGIVTGLFAKETVVGTLDALYSPANSEHHQFDLVAGLQEAVATIPENLSAALDGWLDPLGLSIVGADQQAEQGVQADTFNSMATAFGSSAAAFAYLVFVLLYTPCVATLGAMVREAGMRWMLFVAGWSTALAYCSAVICYQLSQLSLHPLTAFGWVLGCSCLLALGLWQMRRYGVRRDQQLIPLTPVS
ncbi:ferrous iron transport protein B [Bacterioplanes sanyensis]|uniref:Fe(2+) transporter permease subunit FeoB n=1 Tax=Bacterioplanes sanyensis TaxID=1249553 RepID=UPI0016758521|nr:Fe(2+) transporter permease subunit FeoB [Bacterioplanes sanyensis]GGY44349.1 ferrous iron transport protein B [Bacterioplanes sanyensis]